MISYKTIACCIVCDTVYGYVIRLKIFLVIRLKNLFFLAFAFEYRTIWVEQATKGKTMNYQTIERIANEVIGWLFSDVQHVGLVIGAIVVIGAIRGIYRSMTYCGYRSHVGRRVL